MIRCALAEIRRLPTSTRRRRSPSISSRRTRGSRTTPLPITQVFSECRIPEGIRWNLNSSPSRTIVWPALLPPWKRTIASARSARRSVTLPLPSSPHWAPTITSPGMTGALWSVAVATSSRYAGLTRQRGRFYTAIVAEEGQRVAADLDQARDGPRADLLLQLLQAGPDVGLGIARDQDRALVLVALVDERVELLDDPVGVALGAEVVDVEEVDGCEALEEGVIRVLG